MGYLFLLFLLSAITVNIGYYETLFLFLKIPSFFFFLSLFLIFEIYFRFKVAKMAPSIALNLNDGENTYQSFTLFALEIFKTQKLTQDIIKKLLKKQQVKFILGKSDIDEKELPLMDISKEEFGKYIFSFTKNKGFRFVTTMDIIAAYILMIEPKTKLLFSKKLKEDDFIDILRWARFNYPLEENPKKTRVEFWGEGIGEEWVYGWTLETKKYMEDITVAAINEKQVLVERNKEYKNLIESLLKPEINNTILVGEVGVGITNIVKKLASDSYAGNLPGNLYHRRFFQLLTGLLLAGISDQGDLEARIQAIVEEISHSGNVIIFIPQFQDIVGASGFNLNLTGVLLPYLKEGRIQIIASVTPGNYKKYIEPAGEFTDAFEVIKIDEPSEALAMHMLLGSAKNIEEKNKVNITFRSIVSALKLSIKYSADRVLPGRAVVLLNDVANSVNLSGKKNVEEEDVIRIVEEKTKIAVGAPSQEEKELLLHLEDKIHERVIDQKEGVSVIGEALRRVRTGLSSNNKPISFLFLGPTGVGKTETAKALSAIYFKGEDKMIRLDMSEYTTNDGVKRLLGAPPGEGDEKGELTEKVHENPFSLVLLDEFEKASPQIHDLFLQVLDDGRLTDNKGKTVSFVNTIIIATSNAGSEFIREEIKKGTIIDKDFQQKLLDLLQTQGIFKPELLNRFDGVVVFKPLGPAEAGEITKLALNKVSKKLSEQDITIQFDEKIVQKVIGEGFNQEFGARPLNRYIQDNIEDLISQKILKDEIKRGDKIIISTNEQNNIVISS
ncbi:MAG: ATP-dependent Clp protease ATP-binding subunit [Candidatus Levybacteria bacterium]|nr:ATP-dependent Clp protease ATP-binding subunit [Candidatus Levybacteria bacterium]